MCCSNFTNNKDCNSAVSHKWHYYNSLARCQRKLGRISFSSASVYIRTKKTSIMVKNLGLGDDGLWKTSVLASVSDTITTLKLLLAYIRAIHRLTALGVNIAVNSSLCELCLQKWEIRTLNLTNKSHCGLFISMATVICSLAHLNCSAGLGQLSLASLWGR